MPERVELTLENLRDLGDGKSQIAFGLELKRAMQDCLNRPTEKKARTVSLEVKITPVEADGDCEGVDVAFDIKSKVPPRRTNPYRLGITAAGQAWFHRDTEEQEPDQKQQAAGE